MLVLKRLFNLGWIIFSVLFNFKLTGPERLRIFFEKSGGAFIKLGQILALRQDFLPLSYVNELLKLLNRVPEISFIEMQKIFIDEYRQPAGKFFLEFNTDPIASGSIAQVYSARLPNGDKVAVKIQRPDVRGIFKADFSIICFFADIFDFFRIFSAVRAVEITSEFISWTRRELDFTYESKNAAAIYEHSKEHPQTIIPRQYPELTTPRILVQEFIKDGIPLEKIIFKKIDRSEFLEKKINIDAMANYLIKDEMRQYFIDGFFHADPHPANLIFLPEDKLAYLDFGIVGEVKSKENRLLFLKTLYGVSQKDLDLLSRHFFEFGKKILGDEVELFLQIDPVKRKAAGEVLKKIKEVILLDFKKEMGEIMNPWFDAISNPESSLYKKSASVVFLKMIRKAEEYGVRLPKETTLFFRTLSILEMVALQISPSFDMIKALNLFFLEYPLDKIEILIKEGVHEEMAGKKIIPLTEIDWEFFVEIAAVERERMMIAKERTMEMIFRYAEQYEEIRSMLKQI